MRPFVLPVRVLSATFVSVLVLGCGGPESTSPDVSGELSVSPASTLVAEAGAEELFQARLQDAEGRVTLASEASWSSADPAVARSEGGGRFVAVGPGTTTVTAHVEGLQASAGLEVYVAEVVDGYQAGERYTGRRDYVEYRPGTLPVVVSAPHGGRESPAEMENRSYGVLGMDRNTAELAEALRDALEERLGAAPHLVVSRLHRTKLDPNRALEEAAQGDPFAEQAWREYHGFLDTARAAVEAAHGAGLYLDIHGHGHPIDRVELGYLLGAEELRLPDSVLAAPAYVDDSSIRALVASTGRTLPELVRGPASLGGLLRERGVRVVPSPSEPDPGEDPYFTGGYSTVRHGSRDGGQVSGIQLEHPYEGVRDEASNREAYARTLASAVEAFLRAHDPGLLPPGA